MDWGTGGRFECFFGVYEVERMDVQKGGCGLCNFAGARGDKIFVIVELRMCECVWYLTKKVA